MERSSKRKRLSGATKGTSGNSGTGVEGGFAKAVNGSGDDDEDHGKDTVEPTLTSTDYYPSSAPSLSHLPELDLPEPTPVIHDDLRRRQSWAYPGAERWHRQGINPVVTAIGAVETVITSVYEIIIDQGTTSVGEFTVPSIPTAPTVIVLPTFGTITIPVFSQPTQSQSGLPVPGSSGLPPPGSTTQLVITAPSTPLPTKSASTSVQVASSEASAFPTHTGGGNSSTSCRSPLPFYCSPVLMNHSSHCDTIQFNIYRYYSILQFDYNSPYILNISNFHLNITSADIDHNTSNIIYRRWRSRRRWYWRNSN